MKLYAKINDNKLVSFPYTFNMLLEENPHTNYDARYDLIGWYEQTEEGLSSDNYIVEVIKEEMPEIDQRTERVRIAEEPVLDGDVWKIKWIVTKKTKDEIDAYDESRKPPL